MSTLPMFCHLHQLDIEWGYGQTYDFFGTFHMIWGHIAPRLKVLRLQTSATNIIHLADLPPLGVHLEELLLAVETRDSDEWGDTDRLGAVAGALVIAARGSLTKLDITFRAAPRWGRRAQDVLAGLFFKALEDVLIPRLKTVVVHTPFRGEDCGSDELALANFLHTQAVGGALEDLSITPGSADISSSRVATSNRTSTYTSFLRNFVTDAHTWSHIRKLSLPVPPVQISPEAFDLVLQLIHALSSPLKEVSLNERLFDIHEATQVIEALALHAHSLDSLRMGVEVLTPALCDALAAQLVALDTLEIVIGSVCGDDCTSDTVMTSNASVSAQTHITRCLF
jgi:hypothetical protein